MSNLVTLDTVSELSQFCNGDLMSVACLWKVDFDHSYRQRLDFSKVDSCLNGAVTLVERLWADQGSLVLTNAVPWAMLM